MAHPQVHSTALGLAIAEKAWMNFIKEKKQLR